MTDNIRLIYNKIENRVDEICNDGFVLKENQQEYETLTDLEDFIDSIPEESGCEVNFTTKNEDLEEEIQRAYYDKSLYDADNLDRQDFNNIAHHFAEWQRQQMMKNVVLETEVLMDCDGDGIETPYEEWLTLEDTEIPYVPDGFKDGDIVKVILIKEDLP